MRPERWLAGWVIALLVVGCAARAKTPEPGKAVEGIASYYAHKFHGRKTANGETFDMHALTAAHPTLPFHSRVRVTNLENGKQIVVRINDRGPFVKGRIIDVSLEGARRLDFVRQGLVRVRLELLEP